MKLLITTQKVNKNDGNLGFFHGWIREFAKQCEQVTVICLEGGPHDLPKNVRVLSLGKERGVGRFGYITNFYRYIWRYRHEYDAVFVHMNSEYLVLGGFLWKLWHKRVALWYVHHSITWHLRLGMRWTDMVFTAARESFRLPTKKSVYVFGHGIDTELFQPKQSQVIHTPLALLVDARISSSKKLENILAISRLLQERGCAHVVTIIGAAITPEDKLYLQALLTEINQDQLLIKIVGAVPFPEIPTYYAAADIFLNQANIGGLNKVVLQAMACNLYVLTSNEAYRAILPPGQIMQPEPKDFMEAIHARVVHQEPVQTRDAILRDHSLPTLLHRIIKCLS